MWDDRYGSTEEFVYGKQPNDFLKQHIAALGLTSGKCLMLAEGEGRNAVALAELGFDVVGVDNSSVGLEKAKKLAAERGVTIETVVEDLATYDLGSGRWDLIVGIFCHVPPPIRHRILAAVPDALRPGGHFMLECYTPKQIEFKTGGPPVPEMMYSAAMLENAMGTKLGIIRNEELVRDVIEGQLHTGKGSVVQFIGKKA